MFDLEINSLPSSTTREDSALCCDTCIRKEEPNQLAVVYCKTCTAKFCAKHKEVGYCVSPHSVIDYLVVLIWLFFNSSDNSATNNWRKIFFAIKSFKLFIVLTV